MDQYDESELSEITIDYARNMKFFDKKYMKNNAIARGIGWGLSGVGAVCVILPMLGLGFWMMRMIGWPLLIVGVVILCVVLAKQVKESEIIGVLNAKSKQFSEICREKLDFPDDFSELSMTFMGCRTADGDDLQTLRRLRSGNYANPNPEITVLYLNLKKQQLFIGNCRFSLVKAEETVDFQEIPFSDFDKSELVSSALPDGGKISRFVLSCGNQEIYSAPLWDSDYYKEQFIADIIHKKELHSR